MNEFKPTRVIGGLLPFVLLLAALAVLPRWMEHREDMPWLGPTVGIGMLVIMMGSLAALLWLMQRNVKRYGHKCPACGKQVSPPVAIATGNCSQCGERVFEEDQTV